jgi:xanthine/CO dehydrogenase XdhC/CoxF family maturation factor
MNPSVSSLDPLFHDCVLRGDPLVLATVVQTIGSTYRKPGAQMLIAGDGRSAGLLSGGCLESDLLDRARTVLGTGQPMLVDYDSRGSDDVIWGLGLGCEGAMRILLLRLDQASGYEPYAFQTRCRAEHRPGRIALVIESADPALRLGTSFRSDAALRAPDGIQNALTEIQARPPESSERASAYTLNAEGARFLISPVLLRTRLLLLGAGPDAMPLAEFAGILDWDVTVFDHRAAYAVAQRFPRARRVQVRPAAALAEELANARYDAAVVMSHHLPSDQLYLSALAHSTVPYVGLLGPAPRRARLLHEIGSSAEALQGRLYGPVGLDIGASTPEGIALAIVAEILAVRANRAGGSFSKSIQL